MNGTHLLVWGWLPARTDSRRVTLPSTIAAALDIPTGEVSVALAEMERGGYVVRDAATGTRGGWHRGKPLPKAEGDDQPPAEEGLTLY